jgi:transposase-like protein/IS1 family transposase
MGCAKCEGAAIRWGKDRQGNQRWKCKACEVTWADLPARPLAPMRLPMDRVVLVLSLMVEGMSIRSAERVTGHHRDTIMRLVVLAGRKCERLLDSLVKGVEVEDVQADEIWGFVGCKQKTKERLGITDPEAGDAYTFVAIERGSKLVLAHHVGRGRNWNDADLFVSKLAKATTGPFQFTTDGFDGYPDAVRLHLWHRADYAQLIKMYGEDPEGARRYSPGRIIGSRVKYVNRYPDPDRICTSHVERQNLTMRMQIRRLTRLTNAFSKKWENLRASVALHMAHYNLCRFHSSIRMTPAMKAGLVRAPWRVADLLVAVA